jgi:hypothetical protein
MRIDSLIIDNFLDDPDYIRNVALNSEFNLTGSFPGRRTYQCDTLYNNEVKNKLEKVLNLKIVDWNKHFDQTANEVVDLDTSCFQLCLDDAETWIHPDPTEFTGILYLTPDSPVDAGTGIYRHKQTGIYKHSNDCQVDDKFIDNWEIITFSGNIYNRMFIFRGDLYHRSVVPGFGVDKYSGRLTQTFFFNTEEYKNRK